MNQRLSTFITTAVLTAATATLPLAAAAQTQSDPDQQPQQQQQQPQAPQTQTQPSYARPSYGSDEETLRGRIRSFDGEYHVQIRDDRGFIDNVELHQGTVINPTGLRLSTGMSVTVLGYNRGHVFAANEIDTPYDSVGPAYGYYPGYYGYGYYPGYVYGAPYAWGPAFGLGFYFGDGGWHNHGYYGRGGFGYGGGFRGGYRGGFGYRDHAGASFRAVGSHGSASVHVSGGHR